MKSRLPLLAAAAAASLLLAAGCGEGGSGSASDPSAAAPPDSLLFVEGTVRPTGELKTNVDAIAAEVGGIEDLGAKIVEELESSSGDDGEPVDFEKEVEPWLGDRAAAFFRRFDGEDFTNGGVIVATTDAEAARSFVDRRAEESDESVEEASYAGVDYKLKPGDGEALGVVGDFVVFAEGERSFKAVVDASEGDALADEAGYEQAISAASSGSLADVYLDVGRMIEEAGEEIDAEALGVLRSAGIEPREATAVASIVPGEELVEVELSSDLGGEEAPSGDASELLGSLPAGSFAAIGVAGFGKQLREAIDSLDESGIPGEVPPGGLKSGLKQVGIDLDEIAGSLGDAGVFAEGSSESSLGGALVLETDGSNQATNTVSNLGLLLRSAGAPGITAVNGEASGFSIRDEELGDKPLVVVAKGSRIAVGYGLAPALAGVAAEGPRLSTTPAYKEAVAALGGTPIGAFADGPAALRLAEALVPASDDGFQEALPYLRKISSVAIGSVAEGDLATAKLIVSLK